MMAPEDTRLLFLAKEDTDYKPGQKWKLAEGPACADKLLFSSECKDAKRYSLRPLSVDFQIRRQTFYSAEDAACNKRKIHDVLTEDLMIGYSADGEFTIGMSAVTTYFLGMLAQGASKYQTLPEIRLETREITYRFLTCWIRGIRFYFGRGGGLHVYEKLKHTVLQPLSVISFSCQKASWTWVEKDPAKQTTSIVEKNFAPEITDYSEE